MAVRDRRPLRLLSGTDHPGTAPANAEASPARRGFFRAQYSGYAHGLPLPHRIGPIEGCALGWLIGEMGNYAAQHTADKFTFAVPRARSPEFPVLGLIILVLAEIFRQGLRLEEDAQLIV